MRFMGALVVATTVVIAAGCSGDAGADDATTTTERPTTTTTGADVTSPPTSRPPSTTEATNPPTTAPEPTTSTSEAPTSSTSSAGTTTTHDEFATAAIEVTNKTEASWDAVLVAFGDPFDEAKVEALGDFFTGNQLEGFMNLIEEFRDGNFRSVPRPDMPEIYVAEPGSLALDLEQGVATLQVCHVDTSLIVETAGNPDGTDRVVSDVIEQEIVELDVVRVDGVWKVESARPPDTEIAECP